MSKWMIPKFFCFVDFIVVFSFCYFLAMISFNSNRILVRISRTKKQQSLFNRSKKQNYGKKRSTTMYSLNIVYYPFIYSITNLIFIIQFYPTSCIMYQKHISLEKRSVTFFKELIRHYFCQLLYTASIICRKAYHYSNSQLHLYKTKSFS